MESTSLTKAHDHARAAQTSDITIAVNEHALAAGEFSTAAKSTTSVEALRTLKLLEQHHQKISELLKYPLEHQSQHTAVGSDGTESEKTAVSEDTSAEGHQVKHEAATLGNAPAKTTAQASVTPPQRRYPPSRELSSSIASNLASARGIRSKYRGQPLAPSISSELAPGSVDGSARKDSSRAHMHNMLQKGKPSWVPPTQGSIPPHDPNQNEIGSSSQDDGTAQSDDGFSRFYSTFGSIINRLSAPLSFAGLPLITEEQSPEPVAVLESSSQRRNRTRASQVSSPDPELSRIYSKAALRTIPRDGQDSFYVVPKTGHTVSYANILSFDQKEKRRMAASLHGDDDLLEEPDEDDFVDARESQAPLSPATRKRLGKSRSEKDLQNVIEELYTENQSLKGLLDKLSKRLHAFEANAQNSHMALQESIRFLRPGSPLSSSGTGKVGASDELLKSRNKELEEQLDLAQKQVERLEKEHGRMERNLEMYRDKWEKLKAGAKARREAQGSAHNPEGSKAPA